MNEQRILGLLEEINNRQDRMEATVNSNTQVLGRIEQHSTGFAQTSRILGDIRASLKSLNFSLVTILLVLAIAVSLGFVMSLRALTNTNATVKALGVEAAVSGIK